MTSGAAALTEQIADVLYEHMARTEKTGYIHGCKCGWSARPDLSYRAHLAAEIAARLADSRPVVSEAAIEASGALEDAANDLERDPNYHDTSGIITGWLRARASSLRLSPTGDDTP